LYFVALFNGESFFIEEWFELVFILDDLLRNLLFVVEVVIDIDGAKEDEGFFIRFPIAF
jgi:hypothetical protein